jgi:hypothetical protein
MIGARYYHTNIASYPAIATSTPTLLLFGSAANQGTTVMDWDTHGFHSLTVSTARMTIPSGQAGKYYGIVGTQFAGSATNIAGYLQLVHKNSGGTVQARAQRQGIAYSTSVMAYVTWIEVSMAVGDYLESILFHNRGSNLGLSSVANQRNFFSIRKVA